MIRHYEVGVMFLPWLCDDGKQNVVFKVGTPAQEHNCSEICFPLPYCVPVQPYAKNDKQWMWDVSYVEPDVFGNTWPL